MFNKKLSMTTILNFKKIEVTSESKEAAIANVEENYFHINGDATQAYKNWVEKQTHDITDRDIKEFMLEYLSKKTKNCPNAGFVIVAEPAVCDTRLRPYEIENVKNEEGKRKFKTVYAAVDNETGVMFGKWDTNKADALNSVKEMYKSGEYKGSGKLIKIKEVVEGQATVATFKYAPSKNTKKGRYIFFGIEK